MKIEFTASTLADLVDQMRAFLVGAERNLPAGPPTTDQPTPTIRPGTTPIPTWAPRGSTWMAMPGAPALIGPDGESLPVDWSTGRPEPGTAPEPLPMTAAGRALLDTTRGTQP